VDYNPIICALDTNDCDKAVALAKRLSGSVGAVKLGLEFFTANGAAGVQRVAETGQPIFLDLKFHDIPNTVAGAVRSLKGLPIFMTTIHTIGGYGMMKAAADAARENASASYAKTHIIGVTVLTSMDGTDLQSAGVTSSVPDQVRRLAALAQKAGLDGVVCSPHEIEMLRAECGDDFLLVVPGIRPEGSAKGDQKRVMAPREAMRLGANYLVIGRPITQATDPKAAAEAIRESLA
jgi:orotidine-5'-phosphate decarboxylase